MRVRVRVRVRPPTGPCSRRRRPPPRLLRVPVRVARVRVRLVRVRVRVRTGLGQVGAAPCLRSSHAHSEWNVQILGSGAASPVPASAARHPLRHLRRRLAREGERQDYHTPRRRAGGAPGRRGRASCRSRGPPRRTLVRRPPPPRGAARRSERWPVPMAAAAAVAAAVSAAAVLLQRCCCRLGCWRCCGGDGVRSSRRHGC